MCIYVACEYQHCYYSLVAMLTVPCPNIDIFIQCCFIHYIMQSSGVHYADVETLQKKPKPPPTQGEPVQYSVVLPQAVTTDPTPLTPSLKSESMCHIYDYNLCLSLTYA